MKLFFNYLKNFLQEDFNVKYYLTVAAFVSIAITVNFTINLEDGILDQITGYFYRSSAFFLLFSGLYLSVLLINRVFYPEALFAGKKLFWINLFFGILILSMDVAFQTSKLLSDLPYQLQFFISKMLSNLISLISTLLSLFIFYKIIDKNQSSFYGLTPRGFQLKPYLQLYSIVIPLVIIGSFLPGFQQQYPMYVSNSAHIYWNLPEWMTVICYELAYGWNFISLELLFRGFLVIGMIKFLGRHAIIPMAVVYSSIHFGKPLVECISSIFGGYILGVIAYYSRNIWGGVFIHIGLAWIMEIISFLHKIIFN